jgi:hypothetical protein
VQLLLVAVALVVERLLLLDTTMSHLQRIVIVLLVLLGQLALGNLRNNSTHTTCVNRNDKPTSTHN